MALGSPDLALLNISIPSVFVKTKKLLRKIVFKINPVPTLEPRVTPALCFYDLPIPKYFPREKQLASLLIKTGAEK